MDMATADLSSPITLTPTITATDLPHLLNHPNLQHIQVLSLDCFDTLLWRKTATPRDVFYDMQHRPLFQSLGVTAYQRMASAQRAYRAKFIKENSRQVSIHEIYHYFTSLTDAEKNALAEEELLTEIETCYPFMPFVELMQQAKQRGMKVIIVSDIYYSEEQLRKLLSHHLPTDVMQSIDHVFCSVDYGRYKSDGLFHDVLEKLACPANTILHLGDNEAADFTAPTQQGIHALHFSQFSPMVNEVLRLQHSAASLAALSHPEPHYTKSARFSPFRGILSLQNPMPETPETLIGYLTFGPILYAFAQFITDELNALKKAGKTIKPYFLLRDAHLLHQACEAFAGEPLGELARIRKFVAVAASFRTQEDIDYYMSSIQPYYYNFWVICEQLLLPHNVSTSLIETANRAPNPQSKFNELIHDQGIQHLIFKNSADARKNLKQYMLTSMQLNPGDTLVLIDTGYHGVTQDFLTRALKDELNIEIIGRYFIASHEPDRPNCKALITTTWCEHGIFEQCCTLKEGAVLSYDSQGQPIFDKLKLSNTQYEKVKAIQLETLRFIKDAKTFFNKNGTTLPLSMLKQAAEAALNRHIFFPTPQEIHYFNDFQHDKDMGQDFKKTMFNIHHANDRIKHAHNPHHLHPYEQRAINLDLSLSSLMKRAFDLDFKPEEKTYYQETFSVISLLGEQYDKLNCIATPTNDGFYAASFESLPQAFLGFAFGEHYQWLQITSITLNTNPNFNILNSDPLITLNDMNRRQTLFECLQKNAYLMLKPTSAVDHPVTVTVVFRPLVRWDHS
jgi:FMN phosphatase YigB (HAD superfamily)